MLEHFPLKFLLATFAGWVNRHQARAIEFLVEENRVLREQLGDKRIRLDDGQRRRLAAKGKVLGRDLLAKIATIVTPDTILRWPPPTDRGKAHLPAEPLSALHPPHHDRPLPRRDPATPAAAFRRTSRPPTPPPPHPASNAPAPVPAPRSTAPSQKARARSTTTP